MRWIVRLFLRSVVLLLQPLRWQSKRSQRTRSSPRDEWLYVTEVIDIQHEMSHKDQTSWGMNQKGIASENRIIYDIALELRATVQNKCTRRQPRSVLPSSCSNICMSRTNHYMGCQYKSSTVTACCLLSVGLARRPHGLQALLDRLFASVWVNRVFQTEPEL